MKSTTKTAMTQAELTARANAFAVCARTMAFHVQREVFFDAETGLIAFADNSPDENRPPRLAALRARLDAEGVTERAFGGCSAPDDERHDWADPHTVVLLLDVPENEGLNRQSGMWPVGEAVCATVGEIGLKKG
ncbi:hypothetical protein [Alienimonas californiensis]|uniref:Uncharacterized protein n=1 Tax=Alienimonas californiensis TaxID=2527989 RepID=A0A517PBK4_9PLAN|nr:hypothetical protein [Alienimonas californiensis]QDT16742.1 hypothetical protein CA12_28490 [Alienimonas californiensis]